MVVVGGGDGVIVGIVVLNTILMEDPGQKGFRGEFCLTSSISFNVTLSAVMSRG